jgi:hypothetical protein
MSTEALLALDALLVAVRALLPPERWLGLTLRLRRLDRLVAVAAFVLLHYIKFFPNLNVALGVPPLGEWRWGFTPDTASYALVLAVALFLAIRMSTARLSTHNIAVFQNLLETLLFERAFSAALFLLEQNLDGLRRLVEGRHPLMRARTWFEPPTGIQLYQRQRGQHGWLTRIALAPTVRRVRGGLAAAVPNRGPHQKQAERIMERVLLHEPFVLYLAQARPYLGLNVVETDKPFFREPFLKMYVGALLRNPHSALHGEVAHNQNTRRGRYVIDPLNPFIAYFFGEDFKAADFALYNAVSNTVWATLEDFAMEPEKDRYRRPPRDYVETDKSRCPIYTGLILFDIMVTEGLHRGVDWHVWLMLTEGWAERIVGNLSNLGPDVIQTAEFPTPYHYLLYAIIHTQRSWLITAASLPLELQSVHIENVDLEHGNIAKSGAMALGATLRTVLESGNLTPKFKAYMLDVVAHGYTEVAKSDNTKLTAMYRVAVCAGGRKPYSDGLFLRGIGEALHDFATDRHYGRPGDDLLEDLRKRFETM